MADAPKDGFKKDDDKKEAPPSFDFKNFIHSVYWIIIIVLVFIFTFFVVLINPDTLNTFLNFMHGLEIFLGIYTVFLIYKYIDYTYKFQFWNDKAMEFYGGRYKPDKKDDSKKLTPVQNQFNKAKEHIASTYKEEWKIGVIELDNILRELLKNKGYIGETVGDLLQDAAKKDLKSVNIAWDAHKVRNKIVHEGVKYEFSKETAEQVLRKYSTVFSELGI